MALAGHCGQGEQQAKDPGTGACPSIVFLGQRRGRVPGSSWVKNDEKRGRRPSQVNLCEDSGFILSETEVQDSFELGRDRLTLAAE